MSVPVTVQLSIKTVTLDFVGNGIQVNFNLSKFGQVQPATLDSGQDFTPTQFRSLQDQIELLFAKWVARQ